MEDKKYLQIDVERVLHSKSPKLARRIPRFIISYLKRIVHQDKLNAFLEEHQDAQDFEFIRVVLKHFGVIIEYKALDDIDWNDRYIVTANHPLGGLDGLALMYVVGLKRKDLVFPVNDLLLHIPNLRNLFLPLNKHGMQSKDTVRLFDEALQSDKLILYFPAGLVSRKRKGIIRDLEWKKTVIQKARQFHRKLIPVYISGRNSNFFYTLANIRKFLGIRFNVEMIYLVDEMYKQYHQKLRIYFGKPLSVDDLPADVSDEQKALILQELVYSIPHLHDYRNENWISVNFQEQ